MKPNFILGVGCQKGGTTWLYQYLRAHPSVNMAPVKEMHVFDAVFMPELFGVFYRQSLLGIQKEISGIIRNNQFIPDSNSNLQEKLERFRIYYDLPEYNRYFLRLANGKAKENPGAKVVGEITPSYAALNAEHFARIRSLLKEDFNIKVVFLMRDPVERIWSSRQMLERKLSRGGASQLSSQELFKATFTGENVAARTAYDKTIKNLEQVFGRGELFYGFYETLFDDAEIARLCAFLGVDYAKADFEKKINASILSGQSLDLQLAKEARAFYEQTYKFCADRFSEAFIRKIWANYSV